LIRTALPSNKPRKNSSKINRLVVNEVEIQDATTIAENFIQHFISIGEKLADLIKTPQDSFKEYLNNAGRVATSIYLEPAQLAEVFNKINSLGPHLDKVSNNIDAYFIRIACDIITPYLTQLCWLSFEFGIFPDCLKVAKIIPIFKNGVKSRCK